MKKTFLFLTCLLATATLWADEPTASVASVQIYYCQPENAVDNVVTKNPEYIWGGMTLTESGVYQHKFINRLGCDSTVTLTLTIEKPAFSVSSTTKVVFAPGNLQWCANDGTHTTHKDQADNNQPGVFRFAAHQWEMIGANSEANTSSHLCEPNSWTDLMVYGNIYDNRNKVVTNIYFPYACSSTNKSSFSETRRMDNTAITLTAKEDWGYHEIQNKDKIDAPGTWRSITNTEFDYLLRSRSNADYLRGFAKVNDVKGVILLPDGCDLSTTGLTFTSYATLTNVGEYWNDPSLNVYSEVQWQQLEALGAVFLPLAGRCTDYYLNNTYYRTDSDISSGYYWISPSSKNVMYFDFGSMKVDEYGFVDQRNAVRLVKNAN